MYKVCLERVAFPEKDDYKTLNEGIVEINKDLKVLPEEFKPLFARKDKSDIYPIVFGVNQTTRQKLIEGGRVYIE